MKHRQSYRDEIEQRANANRLKGETQHSLSVQILFALSAAFLLGIAPFCNGGGGSVGSSDLLSERIGQSFFYD